MRASLVCASFLAGVLLFGAQRASAKEFERRDSRKIDIAETADLPFTADEIRRQAINFTPAIIRNIPVHLYWTLVGYTVSELRGEDTPQPVETIQNVAMVEHGKRYRLEFVFLSQTEHTYAPEFSVELESPYRRQVLRLGAPKPFRDETYKANEVVKLSQDFWFLAQPKKHLTYIFGRDEAIELTLRAPDQQGETALNMPIGVWGLRPVVTLDRRSVALTGNQDVPESGQRRLVRRVTWPEGEPSPHPAADSLMTEPFDGAYRRRDVLHSEAVYWSQQNEGHVKGVMRIEFQRPVTLDAICIASVRRDYAHGVGRIEAQVLDSAGRLLANEERDLTPIHPYTNGEQWIGMQLQQARGEVLELTFEGGPGIERIGLGEVYVWGW